MKYEIFKTKCEELARSLDCLVDVKYYDLSRYGVSDWFAAYFEIDRFGGIACEVAFINDNFRYSSTLLGEKIYSRLEDCFENVTADVMHTRETRGVVGFEDIMANYD